jgi:hypothetical protein
VALKSIKWPRETKDLLFYVAALIIAGGNYLFSSELDYKNWGKTAAFGYMLGVTGTLAIMLFSKKVKSRGLYLRIVLVGIVSVFALLIPLASQVSLEAKVGKNYIQPEAIQVEKAGQSLYKGKSPYVTPPKENNHSIFSKPQPLPVNDYFPYLPGLIPFGFASAAFTTKVVQDARVWFFIFSVLLFSITLLVLRFKQSHLIYMLIGLFAFPAVALPLSTGGDDIAVIAMCFVSSALILKKRPYWGALAIGFTATMKFTAWPLLVLLIWVSKDRLDRSRRLASGVIALFATLPILVPIYIKSPYGFVVNVIRFPLGLAGTKSPAASPMLGHLVLEWFPQDHYLVTALMAGITFVLLFAYIRYRPVIDVSTALYAAAFGLAAYIILAPTTRYGYFIYPFEFILWAVCFRSIESSSTQTHNRSLEKKLLSLSSF